MSTICFYLLLLATSTRHADWLPSIRWNVFGKSLPLATFNRWLEVAELNEIISTPTPSHDGGGGDDNKESENVFPVKLRRAS